MDVEQAINYFLNRKAPGIKKIVKRIKNEKYYLHFPYFNPSDHRAARCDTRGRGTWRTLLL